MTLSPRAADLQARFAQDVRSGVLIMTLFFGAFGGWAAFAPLSSAIIAPGAVVVSGNRQAVQHLDGGIVKRLLVEEGERVQEGQVLLELDDTDLRAEAKVLTTRFITLAATRSRLEAERDGRDRIEPPAAFAELEEADRALAEQALRVQADRMEARARSLENETSMLTQRIEQLNAQIEGFEAQMASQERQGELLAEELEGTRSLADRGLTPQTRVRALERDAAATEGQRAEYDAQVASAREQIAGQELEIIQLRRAHDDAVMEELQDVEQALSEVEPRREAVIAQVARASLRAPATGLVVGLGVHTESGVIAPGDVLMEIVPEDRPLVVQARVNPSDIDALEAGARAQIRLTAFPQTEAPILYGELSRVSADRMVEEKTGAPYYLAETVIAPEELERVESIRNGAAELRAGMPAEVVFPTGTRTALQYLIEPLSRRLRHSLRES
jgi:HlyD family type I secretion membrane fusion protein